MMKRSKVRIFMSAENIHKIDDAESLAGYPDLGRALNLELSATLVDPESGQQVQVITVDKFLDYTSTTGCSPQSAKKFLATLCNQAERGDPLILQCLFPSPWMPWKILKEGTQSEHGIRVDAASSLYEYLVDEKGALKKFERGYGISQDAAIHLRQILDNLYLSSSSGQVES